jgi:hypothetical protein
MPTRALLLLLLLPIAASAFGQAAPEDHRLVDRVVAVVDEDPILLSDLERAVALGLVRTEPGESPEALRRRALDALIDSRLRLHEISRFGFEPAALDEVDRQIERLRARFPTDASWRAELERLGLEEDQVRQTLARQLAVLTYVEQRLGPRVFVGVDEIQKHYDEELLPSLREQAEPAPPLDEVREAIRAVLRETRLNAEIDRWTRELRGKADVVDLLEVEERPLPRPVLTLEPPGS